MATRCGHVKAHGFEEGRRAESQAAEKHGLLHYTDEMEDPLGQALIPVPPIRYIYHTLTFVSKYLLLLFMFLTVFISKSHDVCAALNILEQIGELYAWAENINHADSALSMTAQSYHFCSIPLRAAVIPGHCTTMLPAHVVR